MWITSLTEGYYKSINLIKICTLLLLFITTNEDYAAVKSVWYLIRYQCSVQSFFKNLLFIIHGFFLFNDIYLIHIDLSIWYMYLWYLNGIYLWAFLFLFWGLLATQKPATVRLHCETSALKSVTTPVRRASLKEPRHLCHLSTLSTTIRNQCAPYTTKNILLRKWPKKVMLCWDLSLKHCPLIYEWTMLNDCL